MFYNIDLIEDVKTSNITEEKKRYLLKLIVRDEPKTPTKSCLTLTGSKCLRDYIYCANCGNSILMHRHFKPEINRFCPSCGQRISWTQDTLDYAKEKGIIESYGNRKSK